MFECINAAVIVIKGSRFSVGPVLWADAGICHVSISEGGRAYARISSSLSAGIIRGTAPLVQRRCLQTPYAAGGKWMKRLPPCELLAKRARETRTIDFIPLILNE
jgi:hypothetical protein